MSVVEKEQKHFTQVKVQRDILKQVIAEFSLFPHETLYYHSLCLLYILFNITIESFIWIMKLLKTHCHDNLWLSLVAGLFEIHLTRSSTARPRSHTQIFHWRTSASRSLPICANKEANKTFVSCGEANRSVASCGVQLWWTFSRVIPFALTNVWPGLCAAAAGAGGMNQFPSPYLFF